MLGHYCPVDIKTVKPVHLEFLRPLSVQTADWIESESVCSFWSRMMTQNFQSGLRTRNAVKISFRHIWGSSSYDSYRSRLDRSGAVILGGSLYPLTKACLGQTFSSWLREIISWHTIQVDSGCRFILSFRLFRVWPILASGSSTSKSSILNQSA